MVPDLEIEEGLDKVCELSIGIWVGVLIFLISYSICAKIITSIFPPIPRLLRLFYVEREKFEPRQSLKLFIRCARLLAGLDVVNLCLHA